MQTRPLGEDERLEDRRYFGAVGEGGSWQDARAVIMDHATDRVAFHRIIMSPGPGQEVADVREWTRMVMDDLSDRLGQELHWVAVVHRNTDHVHTHVLLAGGGERIADPGGGLQPVILRRDHYERLRVAGDHSAEHLREVSQERTKGMRRILSREERRAARARETINAPPGRGTEKERVEEAPPERRPVTDLTRVGAVEAMRRLTDLFRQAGGTTSDPTLDERAGPDR